MNFRLRERKLWKRFLLSPLLFVRHYRILRKDNNILVSMCGAFALTALLFTKMKLFKSELWRSDLKWQWAWHRFKFLIRCIPWALHNLAVSFFGYRLIDAKIDGFNKRAWLYGEEISDRTIKLYVSRMRNHSCLGWAEMIDCDERGLIRSGSNGMPIIIREHGTVSWDYGPKLHALMKE